MQEPHDPGPPAAPSLAPRPRRRTRPGRDVQSLGHAWTLAAAGLAPGFAAERDRMYDGVMVGGQVDAADVNALACMMLLVNYDLGADELIRIVLGADRAALVDAVVVNLLPIAVPEDRRTFTRWMTTALLANGLDPAKVPADALDGVLHHLVGTGRAVPHADFCAAGEFDQARQGLIDLM